MIQLAFSYNDLFSYNFRLICCIAVQNARLRENIYLPRSNTSKVFKINKNYFKIYI